MQATDHSINFEELLDGIQFPATKIELTEYAIEQGASEEATECFRALPDLTYQNMKQIDNDLGEIMRLPGNDNIWESKA